MVDAASILSSLTPDQRLLAANVVVAVVAVVTAAAAAVCRSHGRGIAAVGRFYSVAADVAATVAAAPAESRAVSAAE
jgi:hypothetical protein